MAGYGTAAEFPQADDLGLLPPVALVELAAEYPLSAAQLEAYRKDGFVLLPGVLSPALLDGCREVLRRYTYAAAADKPPLGDRDTYGKAFLQVGGLWQRGGVAKALTFSPRLAGIAARLMGARGALLHHDQCLFKEPGGGHTPWHCDQRYWQLRHEEGGGEPSTSAWIPLQPVPLAMGPMEFAVGSVSP